MPSWTTFAPPIAGRSPTTTRRARAVSAALSGYAHRSMRPELFAWAERASRLTGATGHRLLPLAASAASGALIGGDLARARRLAAEAADAAAGSPEAHMAFQTLAGAALFGGDLPEARSHSRRAEQLADAYGDPYEVMVDRITAILALRYDGRTGEAIAHAEAALAAAKDFRCPSATAWALYTVGGVLVDDDPPRALGLLDEAEVLAANVEKAFLEGVAGTTDTSLRARHGDAETALRPSGT